MPICLPPWSSTDYQGKVLGTAAANLIGYWMLAEPSGTTVTDSSGNGRNGTYTSVTLGDPGIGDNPSHTAALFNGTTGYANILGTPLANAFNGQEMSFSLWFKISASGVWSDGTTRRMLEILFDGSNEVYFAKSSTANVATFQYTAGGTAKTIGPSGLTTTGWTHVAGTISKAANQMKLYINGVQSGSTLTSLGTWTGVPTRMIIGAAAATPLQLWSGDLAHVALWNTPLTASQVAYLASAG